MTGRELLLDYVVTPEKIEVAVRRIIAHANPLQVIVFGSRARGDHRDDSDLDLAVILDDDSTESEYQRVPYSILNDIHMKVDIVVVTKTKYDLHRPWLNSVFNYIDREGVVLYDRTHQEYARPNALHVSA